MFSAQLERAMKLKAQREEIESRRAFSAGTFRLANKNSISNNASMSQSVSTLHSPRRPNEHKENVSPSSQPSPSSQNRILMCSKLQHVFKKPNSATEYGLSVGNRTKPNTATTCRTTSSTSTKTSGFIVPTPETYSIPVSSTFSEDMYRKVTLECKTNNKPQHGKRMNVCKSKNMKEPKNNEVT